MAKRNLTDTVSLTVSTTPQIRAYLEAMAKTGFYGKNPAEVADRLLSDAILDILHSGKPIVESIQKELNIA